MTRREISPLCRLSPHELVLEPAPHGGAAEREIVALAVLRAALLGGEHAQRLVLRAAGLVQRLRVADANLHVVFAVHHQGRAANRSHTRLTSSDFCFKYK